MINSKLLVCTLLTVLWNVSLAQVKILFDATKAESAGNADWVVDANTHNIYWNPTAQIGSGSESNPQRVPAPAQSGITASTPETYWTGGLSNWGVDCAKQGYTVETLPVGGAITYGNSSNAQDLSNYNVFIVCEPNLLFSTAESNAILSYVQAGGSLFMISDHDQSDRNGDGYDSPTIWNDLLSHGNTGITFNLNWFSETSTAVVSSGSDSISTGRYGTVSQVLWTDGTDMTLNTTVNPNVHGVVFRSGYTNNLSKVMFAYARYGNGKIAAIGDSSPSDDGTGDPNDNLYNGYTQDANGNHQKLLMNATIWLANSGIPSGIESPANDDAMELHTSNDRLIIENPASGAKIFRIIDISGKVVYTGKAEQGISEISLSKLPSGTYIFYSDSFRMLFPYLRK